MRTQRLDVSPLPHSHFPLALSLFSTYWISPLVLQLDLALVYALAEYCVDAEHKLIPKPLVSHTYRMYVVPGVRGNPHAAVDCCVVNCTTVFSDISPYLSRISSLIKTSTKRLTGKPSTGVTDCTCPTTTILYLQHPQFFVSRELVPTHRHEQAAAAPAYRNRHSSPN